MCDVVYLSGTSVLLYLLFDVIYLIKRSLIIGNGLYSVYCRVSPYMILLGALLLLFSGLWWYL